MPKLLKFADLKKRFGCSAYRIAKMVDDGILARALPRANGQEERMWLETDAIAAEQKLEDQRREQRRKANKTTVTLRASTARRVRASGLAQKNL